MLEIEYFEVKEGSNHNDGEKMVDLCLFVMKSCLFLYLRVVLSLTDIQAHFSGETEVADRQQ